MDLSALAYHTILGPRPDIFLHAVPAETGSNQVGCRTNTRMRAVVEEVVVAGGQGKFIGEFLLLNRFDRSK